MPHWKAWSWPGLALLCCAAGSIVTAARMHANPTGAEPDRVFELRVYHAVPGKLPALETRFRDTTSKLLAKHDLNVVGYWVSEDGQTSDNAFIFMVTHPSREDAKKKWDELRADPQFQAMVRSEQAEKLVERVDVTYMRPTDFSPMRK